MHDCKYPNEIYHVAILMVSLSQKQPPDYIAVCLTGYYTEKGSLEDIIRRGILSLNKKRQRFLKWNQILS
jgi:hypothetical protein